MTTSTDERRQEVIQSMLFEHWGIVITSGDMIARAIRESDEAAGMMLVPRHPTRAMQNEAAKLCDENGNWPDYVSQLDIWRAMIAAATEADNG